MTFSEKIREDVEKAIRQRRSGVPSATDFKVTQPEIVERLKKSRQKKEEPDVKERQLPPRDRE